MKSEKSKDIALGVFILAIAAVGFLFINPTGAPVSDGAGGMSWRTMPFIYSGLLGLLAIFFIFGTFFGEGAADSGEGEAPESETAARERGAGEPDIQGSEVERSRWGLSLTALRRIAVVLCLIAYSQALEAFGFALSTPIFLFVLLYVFGRTKLIENIAVSLVGGLALWLLFGYALKLPLRGDLWDPLTPALNAAMKAFGG